MQTFGERRDENWERRRGGRKWGGEEREGGKESSLPESLMASQCLGPVLETESSHGTHISLRWIHFLSLLKRVQLISVLGSQESIATHQYYLHSFSFLAVVKRYLGRMCYQAHWAYLFEKYLTFREHTWIQWFEIEVKPSYFHSGLGIWVEHYQN